MDVRPKFHLPTKLANLPFNPSPCMPTCMLRQFACPFSSYTSRPLPFFHRHENNSLTLRQQTCHERLLKPTCLPTSLTPCLHAEHSLIPCTSFPKFSTTTLHYPMTCTTRAVPSPIECRFCESLRTREKDGANGQRK